MHLMKKDLDLVLVNPGSRTQTYQSLGSTLSAVESPVWVGMMATYVRDHGFQVRVLDAHAEDLSPDEAARRIGDMNPRLVAVVVYGHQPSASTQNMPSAGAIVTAVKRHPPELPTMILGGHAAALPERSLREEDADYVAAGEGLHTLVDLIEALRAGLGDLRNVRGLWYRQGRAIRSNPTGGLVQELDREIPQIAWDLLPMDRYRAHNWHCFGHLQRQPYAAIYTTLGCPYHCSFCCIQAPFKTGERELGLKESVNSYRFWSPSAVIAQIDTLVTRYGVRNIKIADEMFVLNQRHVQAICDLIIERGYDLNIWAYARVDTVREGLLDKLKQAGFNWLAFGIEAASERVRTDVDKAFDQELIYKTIGAVRAAGINVIGNYIFGLPEDDLATMEGTLGLALDLNCEFANFYCAMAYPGSQLYTLALKQGWRLPEKWSGYSQHSEDTLPLPTKYLPASEVLRFRDRAFNVYFTSPRYLELIMRKFGPETATHVREMASYRLMRQHGMPHPGDLIGPGARS